MILTDINLLRTPCVDVSLEEIPDLIKILERELEESANRGLPGVGLAGPQTGIYKNIAIIRLDNIKINLINAEIEKLYDPFLMENEGCLSFPGQRVNTNRYREVHIRNYNGRFIATDFLAVACQHELDHLKGILLPDVAIKAGKVKIRPNDQCLCGSGKKYKNCCGRKK